MLCLRKLYFRAFTWLFWGNHTDYKLQWSILRTLLWHSLTKDKSLQPKDRMPIKEIHRCPNTKWAAVTRPRQQGTRIARPTTAEMGHALLHNGVSQVEAALANKLRCRSRKAIMVMTSDHLKTMHFVWRFPLRHAPLAWKPPWHMTQDRIT